jgi:hypothetical protein
MKSYTDIEQSHKLVEFLPIESSDMEYLAIKENGSLVGNVPFIKDDSEVEDSAYSYIYDRIACWSLAALLGVLPNYEINNFGYGIQLGVNNKALATEGDETLLDLVVNMIIYLHELKML